MASISPRKLPKGKRVLPTLPTENPRLKTVTFNDNVTETSIGGTQKVGKIKKDVILHFERNQSKKVAANPSSKSSGVAEAETPRTSGIYHNNSKTSQSGTGKENKTELLLESSVSVSPVKVGTCSISSRVLLTGSSSGSESEIDGYQSPVVQNGSGEIRSQLFRAADAGSQQPRRHTLESKLFGTPDCYRNVNLETPRRMLPQIQDDSIDDGEDSCSIVVAVRVRPFAQRELSDSSNYCAVSMDGNQTIVNIENGPVHRFAYDFSFWSHDSQNGEFSDQETVYKKFAVPLLGKAFEGYNTCLFAYGQTGSGKSFSIMGHGSETGIIPRFCNELFSRAENLKDRKKVKVNVEISFYEIYNEKIHDLLATTSASQSVRDRGGKKQTLKVREHPQLGPYVEGLSNYVVNSFEDVEGWINLGNKNRATATTAMNDKSSRSHSIFTIILTQTKTESVEGQEHDHSITSKINLVDLAGSERQSFANTSGERLREGANINKSLLTLGKVISLLSEKSASFKKRKMFIPYRDSVLTWLLKESLGGNSKTAMMATISPSSLHLEETLSTLRYAQQARSIVNVVRVNEDPKARIIRQLRMEIDKLRAEQGGGAMNEEALAISMAEVTRLRCEMEELGRSWQQRLQQAEAKKAEELQQLERAGIAFKVDNRLPNLVNLNEDPQLSEMLLYVIKEGETKVGRKKHTSRHDIQLTGALIADNHCVIQNEAGIVTIDTIKDAPTYVNGNLVTSCTTLHHGDRVILGGDHFFRFNHPMEVRKNIMEDKCNQEIKDFDYAKQELHTVQEQRLQAEVEKQLEQTRQELSQQKDGYENKLKGLEEVLTTVEQTHKEAQSTIHSLKKRNMMLEQEVLAGRKRQQLESTIYQQNLDDLPNRKSKIAELLESECRQLKEHTENIRLKRTQLMAAQETASDNKSADSPAILNKDGNQTPKQSTPTGGWDLYKMALLLREANKINQYLNSNLTFHREDTPVEGDDQTRHTQIRVVNTLHKMSTLWSVARFEEKLEQMRDIYNNEGDMSVDDDGVFNDPEDVWEKDASHNSTSSPLSINLNGTWKSTQWNRRIVSPLTSVTSPMTPVSNGKGSSTSLVTDSAAHTEDNIIGMFKNIFSMTEDVFSELTLKESIADKILMVSQKIKNNIGVVMENHTSDSSNSGCIGSVTKNWLSPLFQLATNVQTLTSLISSLCSSLSSSTASSSLEGSFLADLTCRMRDAVKTLHHKGNSLLQGCEGRITSLVSESGQRMIDAVMSLVMTVGEMAPALGLHLVRLDDLESELDVNMKQTFLSGGCSFVLHSLDGGRSSLETLEVKCDRLKESSLKRDNSVCGEMCSRISLILNCTRSLLEKSSDIQKQLEESCHHDGAASQNGQGEVDSLSEATESKDDLNRHAHHYSAMYKRLQGVVAQTSTIADSCALLVQSAQAFVLGTSYDSSRLEKCARLIVTGCQRLLVISSSGPATKMSSSSFLSAQGEKLSPSHCKAGATPLSPRQSLNNGYVASPSPLPQTPVFSNGVAPLSFLSSPSSADHDVSSSSSLTVVSNVADTLSPSLCNVTELSVSDRTDSHIDSALSTHMWDESNRNNSNATTARLDSNKSESETVTQLESSGAISDSDLLLSHKQVLLLEGAGQEVNMATALLEEFLRKNYAHDAKTGKGSSGNLESPGRIRDSRASPLTPRGHRLLPASPKRAVLTIAAKQAHFMKKERVAGIALAELGSKKFDEGSQDLTENF